MNTQSSNKIKYIHGANCIVKTHYTHKIGLVSKINIFTVFPSPWSIVNFKQPQISTNTLKSKRRNFYI